MAREFLKKMVFAKPVSYSFGWIQLLGIQVGSGSRLIQISLVIAGQNPSVKGVSDCSLRAIPGCLARLHNKIDKAPLRWINNLEST